MRLLSRVVWSEGMHLAQHHFQAQSRWFEDLTAFTLSSVYHRPYGLVALELDTDALANGTVALAHARGVMPDGTPFHFPFDAPPSPLDIRERFSPMHDAHVVFLDLPEWRADGANCVLDGEGGSLRYRSEQRELPDEVTGRDAQRVVLARKNFRLSIETENVEDWVRLPIARVRRDGAGHFVYDPEFVPPCVQIGASTHLVEMLARLIDMLDAKAEAMTAERARSGDDLAEYAAREVAGFWLSHAIHSAAAPIRHHLVTRTAHPERLYTELARFAGALCTFTLDTHPRDLPLYDHDAPEEGFAALDRFIRRHLDVALPTGFEAVPLQRGSVPAPDGERGDLPGFLTGPVHNRRCFDGHWFLGVRSSARTSEVIERVPKLVKICSAKYIVRLVQEAHPGLDLEHVPSPPAALAPRINTTYFRVRQSGPCWDSISSSAEVGVYVPARIPDADLDLIVVLE